MYLVQSVLFDKSKFSLHLSKEWLKHHHYHHLDVDEKPKTYRFRQLSPKEAKKQGYTHFKTKKLGKSGVSLVLAYNECLCGGGLHNDELHHFLFNSYSSGKDYKTWKLDHSLSDKQVQVYFNPNTGKAVVVHRGSADLQDWYENAKMALGFKAGTKLEHSRKIQKEAERKYGAKNVITLGHSKGAFHAEEVGKNSGEIITLNKPVTTWDLLYGKKVPEHQTDIKTTFDPVSFLRPAQKGKEAENIHSISYNPLTEHLPDVLKRVGDEKYWGKGRCWEGYEPVPGRKPYSKGSCRKTGGAIRTEAQYRIAVIRMKHLLKEDDLLDEEKDELEEKFNDVIEYAEENFYDLDYIDANKFKAVLDLMIKKKIFTKRARDLLNEYFAEEEEEHYSDDDFEPYTGKGRRRKTGAGGGQSVPRERLIYNELYERTLKRVKKVKRPLTHNQQQQFIRNFHYLREHMTDDDINRFQILLYYAISNSYFNVLEDELMDIYDDLLEDEDRLTLPDIFNPEHLENEEDGTRTPPYNELDGGGRWERFLAWLRSRNRIAIDNDSNELDENAFPEDIDLHDNPLNIEPRQVWSFTKWNEELKNLKNEWDVIFREYYESDTRDAEKKVEDKIERFFSHAYELEDNLSGFKMKEELLVYFKKIKSNNIIQKSQEFRDEMDRLIKKTKKWDGVKYTGGSLSGGSFWSRLLNCLRPRNRVHIDNRTPREIYNDACEEVGNFRKEPNGYFTYEDRVKINRMLREATGSFQLSTPEEQLLLFSFIRDIVINNDGFTPDIRDRWRGWYEMMEEQHRIPRVPNVPGNENLTPRDINVKISGKGRELGLSCY